MILCKMSVVFALGLHRHDSLISGFIDVLKCFIFRHNVERKECDIRAESTEAAQRLWVSDERR